MTLDIPPVTAAWIQLDSLAHDAVAPIQDEAAYARALVALDALLAEVGEDAEHPLGDLLRGLIERITAYEDQHHAIPDADPAAMLAFLMDQRELTQREVSDATGINQATISQVLNRKRALTAQQIRSLAGFLGVQFIDPLSVSGRSKLVE